MNKCLTLLYTNSKSNNVLDMIATDEGTQKKERNQDKDRQNIQPKKNER